MIAFLLALTALADPLPPDEEGAPDAPVEEASDPADADSREEDVDPDDLSESAGDEEPLSRKEARLQRREDRRTAASYIDLDGPMAAIGVAALGGQIVAVEGQLKVAPGVFVDASLGPRLGWSNSGDDTYANAMGLLGITGFFAQSRRTSSGAFLRAGSTAPLDTQEVLVSAGLARRTYGRRRASSNTLEAGLGVFPYRSLPYDPRFPLMAHVRLSFQFFLLSEVR